MLELDVRLTADHRLVVIHDALLLRTHYAADSVASLTYRKLQELTRDNPVPLLEDVLREFLEKSCLILKSKVATQATRSCGCFDGISSLAPTIGIWY